MGFWNLSNLDLVISPVNEVLNVGMKSEGKNCDGELVL